MAKGLGKTILIMLASTLVALTAACNSGTTSAPAAGGGKKDAPSGGKSGSGKIELRFSWWGSQDRHDRTLKTIEAFQQKNPDITIKAEFSGWDGYWDKRATQAAGNDLPDIIQMDKKYLQEYADRGLLYDFNDAVKKKLLDLSDVDDAYLSGGRVGNGLYAINIGANALSQAVDPEMYKKAGVAVPKPGWSWDEFMSDAEQLKQKLGSDVYVRGFIGKDYFEYYLRGLGQPFYNKDGTALGFDKKYAVDYLAMLDKLYKGKVLPPLSMTASIKLENELIVNKKAPNNAQWSNQIVALEKAAGRPLVMTMIPIQKGESGDNKSYYIKPGQFLSVYSKSKNQEAAAKFVDFFTNSLEANDILGGERGIPIAKKVREHLYPKLSPADKQMFDFIDSILKYCGPVPPSPAGEGPVSDAFTRATDAVGYGKLTPDAAAAQFMKEANDILGKNKK